MERREIIAKLAEARYCKRLREDEEGCADWDWYFAEQAVNFFESPKRPGEWWYEKDYEDFKDLEVLYKHLLGITNGG